VFVFVIGSFTNTNTVFLEHGSSTQGKLIAPALRGGYTGLTRVERICLKENAHADRNHLG